MINLYKCTFRLALHDKYCPDTELQLYIIIVGTVPKTKLMKGIYDGD
jgi:hypothetical protein